MHRCSSKGLLVGAVCFAVVLFAQAVASPTTVIAQARQGATAEQRRAAADAYRRGSAAYLAEHWAQAARWFENAHGFAPSAPALIQAVRAHRRAGNEIRAATLALRLRALYPDDARAVSAAQEVLEEAAGSYVRVDVSCEECRVSLDETLVEYPSFFVDADSDHTVSASFDTGNRTQRVRGTAGETVSVRFEAPEPSPPAGGGQGSNQAGSAGGGQGPAASSMDLSTPRRREGLTPAIFWIGAGLTVAVGGLTVLSGLDTLAGVDEYEAQIARGNVADARSRLKEGQDKELRTNILIGATFAFAAASIVFALLTDWSGGDAEVTREPIVEAGASAIPGGGLALLRGRLP